MSQYGSVPPPGSYVPPNQGTPDQGFQQQQQQQQQQQAPSAYQPQNSSYGGVAGQARGVGASFGKMMDQAVTSGKPMLNKLGKTISSKLGNKPPGTPQYLQNYQNFQDHQSHQSQPQGYQQQPNQSTSPQPQQQWGQQQQPQQPQQHQPQQQPQAQQTQQQQQPQQPQNPYGSPYQSPFPQSNYATPASGHSGQSNYFPPQQNQAPGMQPETQQHQQLPPPPPPPSTAPFNTAHFEQSGLTMEQYMQSQQGQHVQQGQGQTIPGYTGQQMGIVGGTQGPSPHQNIQSPHMSNVSPVQPMQSQWGPPPGSQQQPMTPLTQGQPFTPVQIPPVPQEQHQQWNNQTPISPHGQDQGQLRPLSVSPSPQQQMNMPPQIATNKPLQAHQPSPNAQHAAPQAAPTEFIAELPADLGNLALADSKPQGAPQYQAYHPPGGQSGSPTPGFTIPRRTVSTTSIPLADPWRFADPGIENPTREFYILADLVFDALDRKFEPKNTGLLEAPKALASRLNLTNDARVFFSYENYSAFGKLWSLEGIPHIMVPCHPSLMPTWNFSQHSHAQDVKLLAEPPSAMSAYATYMPALPRASFYKWVFLELCASPDEIGDMIAAFCSDTYKPGVLNQPDLNKRDRAENALLKGKALKIQKYSIDRVCRETEAAMANDLDALLSQT